MGSLLYSDVSTDSDTDAESLSDDVDDHPWTKRSGKDSNKGDDLSIHSFDEADFLGDERDGISSQLNVKYSKNGDDLSIHSFDEADFLSDEDCDHGVKPVQDKRLNRHTDGEVQDILSPSVSIQEEIRANLRKKGRQARAERRQYMKVFYKILRGLERDVNMAEINQNLKDVSAVKIQTQGQDLSVTETTPVVSFSIEDATDSPPLTPPTPEVLLLNQQVPQAPLNSVTVGVVTPSRPETPPAVGCLPHSRLPPVTNLSADAKKLLQGGLEQLQQDTTKQTTGKKKARAQSHIQPLTVEEDSINNGKEKKKKNVGKRFFQWLSRKLMCCRCLDV